MALEYALLRCSCNHILGQSISQLLLPVDSFLKRVAFQHLVLRNTIKLAADLGPRRDISIHLFFLHRLAMVFEQLNLVACKADQASFVKDWL